MSNAELDNLIDAFLTGDLDAAGRERLVVLLESDVAARRVFDEAVHTEALLSAAHADAGAERRAIDKLTRRLQQSKPVSARAARPVSIKRPAVVNRFSSQRPLRAPGATPIGAWTALAASIAILFGLAFYFIYEPAPKTGIADKSGQKIAIPHGDFAVASGRVTIDGKDARDIAENEWVSVSKDGPAILRAKDGLTVTLEAASRALLRKRGATLLSGAGRFNVQTAAANEPFVLQTQLGTVKSVGGNFEARLEPSAAGGDAATGRKTVALSVTVASGSAQVDFGGKTTPLTAGQSREFREPAEDASISGTARNNGNAAQADGHPTPKLRPRELARVDCILKHDTELALTGEQRMQLKGMLKKLGDATDLVMQDSIVKALYAKQLAAETAHDEPAIRIYQDRIHDRSQEILGTAPLTADPMSVLNDDQRRKMEQFDRDHDRERDHTPGSQRIGDEPPPPPPPPRHPFPPGKKDGPPPGPKDGPPPPPDDL